MGGFQYYRTEYKKDFYRYFPLSNSWNQIEDFPGGNRAYAQGQGGSSFGLVGSGWIPNQFFADFYSLNAQGVWGQFNDFPAGAIRGMSSFLIDNSIVFTTGITENLDRIVRTYRVYFSQQNEVLVYPNPSDGRVYLRYDFGTSYTIIDHMGKAVVSQKNYRIRVLRFCHNFRKAVITLA